MKDSTVDRAHVINQALSVEMLRDSLKFNQVASREMFGFFENGEIRKTEAVGNVQAIYYMQDDRDSSFTNMGYIETDTMRMFMKDRKLERIWTCKQTGRMYPITQIPPDKKTLPSFVWFRLRAPAQQGRHIQLARQGERHRAEEHFAASGSVAGHKQWRSRYGRRTGKCSGRGGCSIRSNRHTARSDR